MTIPRYNLMIFYVFEMALAIAFLCENTVKAIQISFIYIHLPLCLIGFELLQILYHTFITWKQFFFLNQANQKEKLPLDPTVLGSVALLTDSSHASNYHLFSRSRFRDPKKTTKLENLQPFSFLVRPSILQSPAK